MALDLGVAIRRPGIGPIEAGRIVMAGLGVGRLALQDRGEVDASLRVTGLLEAAQAVGHLLLEGEVRFRIGGRRLGEPGLGLAARRLRGPERSGSAGTIRRLARGEGPSAAARKRRGGKGAGRGRAVDCGGGARPQRKGGGKLRRRSLSASCPRPRASRSARACRAWARETIEATAETASKEAARDDAR